MTEERTTSEVRDRAVLPVLIPVAAIVVTEVIVFSMSRILLAGGKVPAVGIALAIALGILVGAAAVAARPRMRTSTIAGLLVVLGIAVVGAGIAAFRHGPTFPKEEGTAGGGANVSAANLAFDMKEIDLPAGKSEIEFHNADTQQHNIAVFKDSTSLDTALFRGKIVAGGQTATYELDLEAGSYYFHCDVHPTMSGTVKVS